MLFRSKPGIFFEITDADGNVMQRVEGPVKKGLHRITWNLRGPNPALADLGPKSTSPWYQEPVGPLALPGVYTATMYKRQGGELTELGSQSFTVKRLEHSPEHSDTPEQVLAFQSETVQLSQAVDAAAKIIADYDKRMKLLDESFKRTAANVEPLHQRLNDIRADLDELKVKLLGDRTVTSRNEAAAWSVSYRVNMLGWHRGSQFDVPGTRSEEPHV